MVIDTIGAGIGDRVIVATAFLRPADMLGDDEINAAVVAEYRRGTTTLKNDRKHHQGRETMKQLICAADVEALKQAGKTVCVVTPGPWVAAGMPPRHWASHSRTRNGMRPAPVLRPELDSEKIYQVLKVLMEKGMLEGLLNANTSRSSGIPNGLKSPRGNTVKINVDTGHCLFPGAGEQGRVPHQRGFLVIENSS